MDTVFQGRFAIRMDAKGRLSLPAPWKHQTHELVITTSISNDLPLLDAYTPQQWNKLLERVAQYPNFNRHVQSFKRFYVAGGQPHETDKLDRFLLQKELRQHAQLGADIVLVGVGEKFEIWSSTNWTALYNQVASEFDSVLETLSALDEKKDD